MSEMRTYEQVAEKVGLSEDTTKRYVAYMRYRWSKEEVGHCRFGYAEEWAERFRDGREYECSDTAGRIVLSNVVDYESPLVRNY